MTKPLSFAGLWHDTLVDTRALMPLALPVAAALVLLPGVAIDRFGPPLPPALRPQATVNKAAVGTAAGNPTATGVVADPRRPSAPATSPPVGLRRTTPIVPSPQIPADFLVIAILLPALIGLIAQLAIIRLALDRRRGLQRSVGEALVMALRAWPLAVVALALGTIPIGLGMLLIVPGLYLAGRLAPAMPLVLDGAGPVAALERSWALTQGNGWRVIGFTALFLGWFVVLAAAGGAIGSGIVALLASLGAGGAGAIVASTVDGAVAAIFTVVNAVAAATVYRALTAQH